MISVKKYVKTRMRKVNLNEGRSRICGLTKYNQILLPKGPVMKQCMTETENRMLKAEFRIMRNRVTSIINLSEKKY